MIRMVGSGSYGKVYEAERNGQKYAVKEVFKEFLIQHEKIKAIFRERDILFNSKDCKSLPKFYHTFNEEDYLYLVMEFVDRGTLKFMLDAQPNQAGLPLNLVKFYSAQLVTILEYFQKE